MSDDSQRRGTGLLGRMFGSAPRLPRASQTDKWQLSDSSTVPQRNEDYAQYDSALFRRCPDCGESVYIIAPRCRHCGNALPSGRVA